MTVFGRKALAGFRATGGSTCRIGREGDGQGQLDDPDRCGADGAGVRECGHGLKDWRRDGSVGPARSPDGFRDAIVRLSLFEREVWLLAARDGLDDREIAMRLALEEAEVRRHLVAALVRLAVMLDDADGDDGA